MNRDIGRGAREMPRAECPICGQNVTYYDGVAGYVDGEMSNHSWTPPGMVSYPQCPGSRRTPEQARRYAADNRRGL